jgi:hypothetical protein
MSNPSEVMWFSCSVLSRLSLVFLVLQPLADAAVEFEQSGLIRREINAVQLGSGGEFSSIERDRVKNNVEATPFLRQFQKKVLAPEEMGRLAAEWMQGLAKECGWTDVSEALAVHPDFRFADHMTMVDATGAVLKRGGPKPLNISFPLAVRMKFPVKDDIPGTLLLRFKQSSDDLCNIGYVAGPINSNNCSHRTQRHIEEPNECGDLADHLQIAKGNPFQKDCSVVGACDPFPKRCFKSADDNKFYYNPSGDMPAAPRGTPYCETVLYINGTDDTNECGDQDYTPILSESECRSLETCTMYPFPAEFRIKDEDAAEQLKHPKGCHISTDGFVEFNNITGTPTAPKGTPLCKLKPPQDLSL